jgi:acetolactate synthase-1/2/3 large subunit
VVDVPKDVQLETVEFARWPEPWRPSAPPPCDPEPVARLAELIGSARSPALYVGGGVVAARAARELRELARRQSIPVASTLNGLGAFPSDDPLSLGMLGMHGARGTNLVLEEADLLLALGARFDDRATGKASEFCPRATVAHVDVDAAEIGKIVRPDLAIVADVGSVLRALLPLVPHDPRPLWRRRVAKLVDEFPLPLPTCDALDHPLGLVRRIAASAPGSSVVTTDVGQHQMWVAQAFPFREPRSLLTSGGLGTMGFGLPAAIGAALARSGARAICVSGDGSWLINVQELATLAELGLDVTAIVMDNRHLGLVRQQQELFYGERYSAARFERGSDFAAIARGFGVRAVDLGRADTPEAALEAALAEPGPCVVHAPIAETENVLPMVPPGAANREMIG